MNAVKQGVIISIFTALFLLQSVSQLLPMHGFEPAQSTLSSFILEPAQDLLYADASLSVSHHTDTHSMMSESCESHCQTMSQDCAEIMCSTVLYDVIDKQALVSAPMQSVNFYALIDYIGFSVHSLYRPPISQLS